jgi:flagellin-like hook-associated protein FlgL
VCSSDLMSTAAIDLGLVPAGPVGNTNPPVNSDPPTQHGTASVTIDSAAPKSGLIFTAKDVADGTANVHVVFQKGLNAAAVYDPVNHLLTFDITPGTTTAKNILDEFNNDPSLSKLFSLTLDPSDTPPNTGSGAVDVTNAPMGPVTNAYETITGSDVHPLETESIFTALLRIQDGLQNNDTNEIQRAMALFDTKVTDMNLVHADLGARQQGLDAVNSRIDNENVELQTVLSDTYDVDVETVATDLTGRQLAYQASLKATALIFSMSLLNYL